ncbi:MAG TPA: hypothetical protein VEZ42_14130 [Pseudonocardia sp.]|nr:hypothetical protein [Pseudonocardia sp.]
MSAAAQSGASDIVTAFLIGQPEAIQKLLADHVDDGRGDCRACSVGGQRGHHTWPCSLHAVAAEARRVMRRDRSR